MKRAGTGWHRALLPLPVSDSQLGRTVLALFTLASVATVAGPIVSYGSDLAEVRAVFEGRAGEQAAVQAASVSRELSLLAGELERRAMRRDLDPTDGEIERERNALGAIRRNTSLFEGGLALLSPEGTFLAGDEVPALAQGVTGRSWWAAFRLSGATSMALDAEGSLVIATPVRQAGREVGVLATAVAPGAEPAVSRGSQDFRTYLWSGGRTLLAVGRGGPAEGAWTALLPSLLEGAVAGSRRRFAGDDRELFAAIESVSPSRLSLVVVGDELTVTDPLRRRFLLRLVLTITLQAGALLLLVLFMWRTYRRVVEAERRAVDDARLVALGQASALIAHEVKNSLNGMKAAGALLTAPASAGPVTGPDLTSIASTTLRGEIERLEHLATSLLLFGRPANAKRVPTELAPLVRGVVDGAQVWPEASEVRWTTDATRAEADAVVLVIDPFLAATALQNVLRNAMEAAVAAKDLGRQPAPAVSLRVVTVDGRWSIEVEDNAGGVDPALEPRLFEPFTTGKPKGIGLGLSMSRRAMETQGGALRYERIAGGSRFTLDLPSDGASTLETAATVA